MTKRNRRRIAARAQGRITGDPLRAAQGPLRILFVQSGFPPHRVEGTHEVANWDFFRGVVLSTDMAERGLRSHTQRPVQRVWGSAVMVAPGVAIGARHVIDPDLAGLADGRIEALLTGVTAHGAQHWRPAFFSPFPGTDLCLISCSAASDLPPDGIYNVAALSTRIPEPGEPIMAVGFESDALEFEIGARGPSWDGRLVMASGKVLEHFPNGVGLHRGRPMLAADIGTHRGMSGGPVFDKDGKLIGILTSGLEGEPPYSFVSLIWPCLIAAMPLVWPPFLAGRSASLLDLAGPGFCHIDDPRAISSRRDASGAVAIVCHGHEFHPPEPDPS